jgi:ribosome-binding protein aMBF1 (putative translation factor)
MTAEASEVHAFQPENHPRIPQNVRPSPDYLFCKNARTRWNELGITLEQLSKTTGIKIGMLKRIDRCVAKPQHRLRKAVAKALGCTVESLQSM